MNFTENVAANLDVKAALGGITVSWVDNSYVRCLRDIRSI